MSEGSSSARRPFRSSAISMAGRPRGSPFIRRRMPIRCRWARRLRRKWRTFPAVSRKTSDMTFCTIRRSFSALTSYVGSTYINQFNKFGLSLQVYAQADSQVRLQPDDLLNMNVRSQDGNMVPRNARPSRPVLAGQYESWILPLAVISAVPLALLGPVTTRGR
jgi:hypothetical protein